MWYALWCDTRGDIHSIQWRHELKSTIFLMNVNHDYRYNCISLWKLEPVNLIYERQQDGVAMLHCLRCRCMENMWGDDCFRLLQRVKHVSETNRNSFPFEWRNARWSRKSTRGSNERLFSNEPKNKFAIKRFFCFSYSESCLVFVFAS